jgi:hypothetical protein
MARDIYLQKAEFLLDSIRRGGLHDLMQTEILNLLIKSGYKSTDLKHYILHGFWPSKKHEEPSKFYDSLKDSDEELSNFAKRKEKRVKRAVRNIIIFVSIMIIGLIIASLFENNTKVEKNQTTVPIEQTKDEKRTL